MLRIFSSNNVTVYIDDDLIMGDSFIEHLELLKKVLATLSKYGIKINPKNANGLLLPSTLWVTRLAVVD